MTRTLLLAVIGLSCLYGIVFTMQKSIETGKIWVIKQGLKPKIQEEFKASTTGTAALIIESARKQLGVTLYYDGAYAKLEYPNGDVPMITGVCADVIIRALRSALKIDLQKDVHLDMAANFSRYPQAWWLKKTDTNIDHRRVRNLMTYFDRQKWNLTDSDFAPGDIVAWRLPDGQHHIGILSDTLRPDGKPLVIHNIGGGAQESDIIDHYTRIGHWRVK